ncbi:MAG: YjgN family protein [Solirubrobacterales bacterium]
MDDGIVGQSALVHHGRNGAAASLAVKNLLLTVLTLGVYRFWAKTNLRRLLWGNTAAWGDPIEYTGTGKELFVGVLVVMLVVFLPLAAAQTTIRLTLDGQDQVIATQLLNVLVMLLIPAGLYRARRYQLSRTQWRGIRGGLGGSAWRYAMLVFQGGILCALTLGWWWPRLEMRLARYRWDHTSFGTQSFACNPRIAPLYLSFSMLWAGSVAAVLAVVIGSSFMYEGAAILEEKSRIGLAAGTAAMIGLPAALLLVLPYAAYRACMVRELAAGLTFGATRFSSEITTWGMIKLGFGNWMISLLSLGILRPVATMRTFRYVCGVLNIHGQPDFAAIRQSEAERPRSGEGLVAVLDGAGDF